VWKGQSVSVVFSTYRDLRTIRACIEELFETGVVDEVVAVDNNAEEGTKAAILSTRARSLLETRQGLGHGFQRALAESRGDILVTMEVDGTYRASDLLKLLAYSDDFEVVCGTRTASLLIGEGAEMGFVTRWSNVLYAKLIEVLFNTSSMTDVGCIFRLMKRPAYERLRNRHMDGGWAFNLDWMLHIIRTPIRFIEIPVNFLPRVGEAVGAGKSTWMAASIAIRMLGVILRHRLNLVKIPHWADPPAAAAARGPESGSPASGDVRSF
jgi:glycosyltransferase involved in cell wall biosynthesis